MVMALGCSESLPSGDERRCLHSGGTSAIGYRHTTYSVCPRCRWPLYIDVMSPARHAASSEQVNERWSAVEPNLRAVPECERRLIDLET